MRTFEIFLNKKRLCIAGLDDDCVLTAMIDCVSRDGHRLDLHVGGLASTAGERVSWQDRRLRVGDEIRIRIANQKRADAPAKRFPTDSPAQKLESKKRYVRQCAKELGWEIRESS